MQETNKAVEADIKEQEEARGIDGLLQVLVDLTDTRQVEERRPADVAAILENDRGVELAAGRWRFLPPGEVDDRAF